MRVHPHIALQGIACMHTQTVLPGVVGSVP